MLTAQFAGAEALAWCELFWPFVNLKGLQELFWLHENGILRNFILLKTVQLSWKKKKKLNKDSYRRWFYY